MPQSRWEIWNVDEATKRKIKAYAVMNGIEIGEAIQRLVDIALASNPDK
jgi:hypothetical protein